MHHEEHSFFPGGEGYARSIRPAARGVAVCSPGEAEEKAAAGGGGFRGRDSGEPGGIAGVHGRGGERLVKTTAGGQERPEREEVVEPLEEPTPERRKERRGEPVPDRLPEKEPEKAPV